MSRYRSQVREVINRNTVVSLALDQGFNAFLPVYDGGVDFILYREGDGLLRKVQLKSRWSIDRKYRDRDIWMAFPMAGEWYLMPHDAMVAMAEAEGIAKTVSWITGGAYSKPRPSAATIAACAPYRLSEIEKVSDSAAEQVRTMRQADERTAVMDSGPLQSDVAHREALDAIETLWGAEEGSAASDRLERLVALVTAYEARRWPIKPLDSDALSLLRHDRAEKG